MRHISRTAMNAAKIVGQRSLQSARRKASSIGSSRTGSSTRLSSTKSNSTTKSTGVNRNSILGNNSFLSKYQSGTTNTALEKSYYTDMGESAASIQDRVIAFLKRGENTLFGTETSKTEESKTEERKTEESKTEESTGNTSQVSAETQRNKIVKQIQGFVDDYNTMRNSMEKLGGQVRQVYIQQLDKQVTRNAKALEEIGITQNKDGTLSAKSSTLREADLEKIKSLFGTADSFANKVSDISNGVEKNARDNLYELKFRSYSSGYSKTGSYSESYKSTTGRRYNVSR
ncbi:MAG: hypothetical protein GX284_00250 [Clostridiales bacterium]|nr:hypothetical protein [Clostridiales bacterium]